MARSQSRRAQSSSRRTQYSEFLSYVVAAIGALVGAALIWFSLATKDPASQNGTSPSDLLRPVGVFAANVRTSLGSFGDNVAAYLNAGSQNAHLKRELARLHVAAQTDKAVRRENAYLKQLLGLYAGPVKPVAITPIIGSSASSSRRFGYIAAGSANGVRTGMTVRSATGVIGRVLSAQKNTAQILLVTDSQSVIPVRLADKTRNVIAFAEGQGSATLRIRLASASMIELKKGDVFVTSGAGGFYRPGLAVAVVTSVAQGDARARPMSSPSSTSYAAVEDIWMPDLIKLRATTEEALPQ